MKKTKKIKKHEVKKISGICHNCGEQFYPDRSIDRDMMMGITVAEGECDVCGKKDYIIPLRDFIHALKGNPCNLMWD